MKESHASIDARPLRIALLERDGTQAKCVQGWLDNSGYQCSVYQTAHALQLDLRRQIFDVIIIDWVLQVGMDGLDLLSWLRTTHNISDVPVIVTSTSSAEQVVVTALYSGADLYLAKPLRQNELLARLDGLIRRTNSRPEVIICPPYTLNTTNREVRCGNKLVDLTNLEYELTVFLFCNRGRVLTREQLLVSVWGKPATLNTRTVDSHICRLRTKLGLVDSRRWLLTSIHRRGYCLEERALAA